MPAVLVLIVSPGVAQAGGDARDADQQGPFQRRFAMLGEAPRAGEKLDLKQV
ncbi:hypothetical protein OF001_U180043 [Pseudomonas sp. OF001]|nr:hypothetical protein OF001_U180043 [Pseudomonas sp. OF001]